MEQAQWRDYSYLESADHMTVMVLGGGARDHALAQAALDSPRVDRVLVAPGNGGTQKKDGRMRNIPVDPENNWQVVQAVVNNDVDLVLIQSDNPLGNGVVDAINARQLRTAVYGPTQAAAEIEASKPFAKRLMLDNGIPTAGYEVFRDPQLAHAYLEDGRVSYPTVIKAGGLALGKGTKICESAAESHRRIDDLMVRRIMREAGAEVVIEDYLDGDEVSLHAACDIHDYAVFLSSQDHKRVLDGDKGEMTGGMGTIAPVPWFNMNTVERAATAVTEPALAALQRKGRDYQGVLYPGIIVERDGNIKVIEYNARFGDPEAQVYLRLMKTDMIEMVIATLNHTLGDKPLDWQDGYAINVVLASRGYPGNTSTGKSIQIGALPDGVELYHGGTTLVENRLYTSGGRVLGVSAVGNTLEQARDLAYSAIDNIHFEGMHYRRDIGLRPRISKSIRVPKLMNLSSKSS